MRFLKNGASIWPAYRSRYCCFILLLLSLPLPAGSGLQAQDPQAEIPSAGRAQISPAGGAGQPADAFQAANMQLLNWAGDDYAPLVAPKVRYLIFQSNRPASSGGHNFWISYNRNWRASAELPDWSLPLPLGSALGSASGPGPNPIPAAGRGAGHNAGRGAGHNAGRGSAADRLNLALSLNSDGFEGMLSLRYEDPTAPYPLPVEICFTSLADAKSGRQGYAGLNIYTARYRNGNWSDISHLNLVNSNFNDRMPALSQDGTLLYFASNRPGGSGGYDLWVSRRDSRTDRWLAPINVGESVNSRYNEIAPSLSADGKLLFFSSDRPGGLGHYDIYMSRFNNSVWEGPRNLGPPFNSRRDDESVSLSSDGNWLFFASDRSDPAAQGDFDIYRIARPDWLRSRERVTFSGQVLDGSSRQPLGLDATIEIYYEKETLVTTASKFNRGAQGRLSNSFKIDLESGRLYRARFSAPGFEPVELQLDWRGNIAGRRRDQRTIILQRAQRAFPAQQQSAVLGLVLDAHTNLALPGSSVSLMLPEKEARELEVSPQGEFHFQLPVATEFRLRASAPAYRSFSSSYRARLRLESIVIRLEPLGGDPCPEERPECIDNLRIYFELDSSIISSKEYRKLEALQRVLNRNPDLQIEIEGHADSSGTLGYNQRLSEARAGSVRQYLVQSGGIEAERLKIRGYSYLRPFIEEATPQQRALNRRVEFRRLSSP